MIRVAPRSWESTICPRRLERSPLTGPKYSSGVTMLTRMMGSRRARPASVQASRKPRAAACSKAIGLESTSWWEPSTSSTLTFTTG